MCNISAAVLFNDTVSKSVSGKQLKMSDICMSARKFVI